MFYLAPEYRGQGYSGALHQHAIEVLHSEGCSTLTLRVSALNLRARRYYQKLGWQDKGQDEQYDAIHLYTREIAVS